MTSETDFVVKSARKANREREKNTPRSPDTETSRYVKAKEASSTGKAALFTRKALANVRVHETSITKKLQLEKRKYAPEYVGTADRPVRNAVFLSYYASEPLDRINMIRNGISAKEAKHILSEFPITQVYLMRALKISPATINRKAQSEDRLLPAESERILGVARLVGQLQAIVEESGNTEDFDATAWMSRWLSDPLPALDGTAPLELLDTMEGQGLVSKILSRVQSGAYT